MQASGIGYRTTRAGHAAFERRFPPLAAIHDPDSIARVLAAIGLRSEVPELAEARGPPEQDWWGA